MFGAGKLVMKLVHELITGCKIQVEIHAHNVCKNFRLRKGDITVETVDIFFAAGKFLGFFFNEWEVFFSMNSKDMHF